ncbi:hypothetical protein F5883DRAFT_565315 [Diaporthe sp. PMI_573]|nr:hypothetical protein F5883DRAFT_565315 [Diaporthaceae sp. PMI_573]
MTTTKTPGNRATLSNPLRIVADDILSSNTQRITGADISHRDPIARPICSLGLFLSNPQGLKNTFRTLARFDFRDTTCITGTHVAAYFGLDALISKAIRNHRRLVDKGARTGDVEFVGQVKGRKALHIAIANEDVDMVKVLLSCTPSQKPDLDMSDSSGWTALRYAAAYAV